MCVCVVGEDSCSHNRAASLAQNFAAKMQQLSFWISKKQGEGLSPRVFPSQGVPHLVMGGEGKGALKP